MKKKTDDLKLQYQLATGRWVNCEKKATEWEPAKNLTEEFLTLCEKFNGMSDDGKIVPISRANRTLTRDEVIDALLAGNLLRNDSADWFSNCRSGAFFNKITPVFPKHPRFHCKKCGGDRDTTRRGHCDDCGE